MSPQKHCPACGRVNSTIASACTECGHRFGGGRSARRGPSRQESFLGTASTLRSGMKKLMILGFIVLGGYVGYLGVVQFMKSLEPPHPHPTDPAETARTFFTALAAEDYQTCYSMLEAERKTAVVVGTQSRTDGYTPHFERIREYLGKYAGSDFSERMTVSENGVEVSFPNNLRLHLKFSTSTGSFDNKKHYGIHEIREFPIDAMAKLGVQKYYRGVSRMMDQMEEMGDTGDVKTLSSVITKRPGESDRGHLDRMARSFYRARQLDIKHGILEWIIMEYPEERATLQFLDKLRDEKRQPAHLRAFAQNYLNQYR